MGTKLRLSTSLSLNWKVWTPFWNISVLALESLVPILSWKIWNPFWIVLVPILECMLPKLEDLLVSDLEG